MNNVELLKSYVEALDSFENGRTLLDSEYYTISSVRNNAELSEIVGEINSLSTKADRLSAIVNYQLNLNSTQKNEIHKIKQLKLNNGYISVLMLAFITIMVALLSLLLINF